MIKYRIYDAFERVFMRFLKENSYDILRLYINQIGITIFSLVLYTSISSLDSSLSLKLKIAISIFSMLFFFALLYTVSWDWGANDKIRIDAGRVKKRAYKGALMALMANAINFVLAATCVICDSLVYFKGIDSANAVSQIANLILRLTNAMYLGLIQGIFVSFKAADFYILLQSLAFLAAPLLAILVTHIGYTFGLKNIKIFPSTKNKKQKK